MEGKEQNYWPGFVDALSNVVLTLVFVLVVFVFALVISANKVEERATQIIQEACQSKATDKTTEDEKATQHIKGLVKIVDKDSIITLNFPFSISDLDEKSLEDLDVVLNEYKTRFTNHRITLRSTTGKESYSAARRLAYYRVLNLRNHLINRKDCSPFSISNQIVESQEPTDGRVEIIIEK
jgi:hypothetical protein